MTLICWGMVGKSDDLHMVEKQHVQEIHDEFHQAHWMILTLLSTNMAIAAKNVLCSNFWEIFIGGPFSSYVRQFFFVGKDSITKPPIGCSFAVDSKKHAQTRIFLETKTPEDIWKKLFHQIFNHNFKLWRSSFQKKGVKIKKKWFKTLRKYPPNSPAKNSQIIFFTRVIQGGPLLVINGVISYNPYKWPKTNGQLGL